LRFTSEDLSNIALRHALRAEPGGERRPASYRPPPRKHRQGLCSVAASPTRALGWTSRSSEGSRRGAEAQRADRIAKIGPTERKETTRPGGRVSNSDGRAPDRSLT
jgi:hypothetical protein